MGRCRHQEGKGDFPFARTLNEQSVDRKREMMRKHLQIFGGSILVAGLLACAAPVKAPSPIEFNYVLENARANGIVQTFDMGGKTMIQIRNIDAKSIQLIGANSKAIPFSVIGETAIMDSIYPMFKVVSVRGTSNVTRKYSTPVDPGNDAGGAAQIASVAKAPGPAAADGEHLRREITRIQAELTQLKVLLAFAAGTPAPTASTEVVAVETMMESEMFVRVNFGDNSDDFVPAPHVHKLLLVKAQKASSISVRGFTDSAVANPTSAALARSRALAARNFLTRHGVARSKISVGFEPAGKFIADNKTKEGKGANRRVEINLS